MTDGDHRRFAEILYDLKGMVVLSGYPAKIYEQLFESRGWQRHDRRALIMGGGHRTECVWLSPATTAALNQRSQAKTAGF